MREIKFRYVFKDLNTKEIFYQYYTLEEFETDVEFHFSKNISIISRDKYTGLKDKNGKKIYEGDVYFSDYAGAFYKIIFSDEYLGFFCITENQNVCDEDLIIPLHDQLIEITGNIHENGNLLNEK